MSALNIDFRRAVDCCRALTGRLVARDGLTDVLHYHIVSRWRVKGRLEEVASMWLDSHLFARWWRAAFLDVRVLCQGDRHGLGRIVDLHTKGWLPYTLRLQGQVIDCDFPHRLTIVTWGDLCGRAECRFAQDQADVTMICDWSVTVHKPVVRWLSFLCKPLCTSNHRWVMAQGERALQKELRRRRTTVAAKP